MVIRDSDGHPGAPQLPIWGLLWTNLRNLGAATRAALVKRAQEKPPGSQPPPDEPPWVVPPALAKVENCFSSREAPQVG